MANSWFRLYEEFSSNPKIKKLSVVAQNLSLIAHELAWGKHTCYPNWRDVETASGLMQDEFMCAFDELCEAGIVFKGFPSLLIAYAERFPLAPMFGPIGSSRPSSSVWARVRSFIFARDNYTCSYCGLRGVELECDHIVPVSKGGHHGEENLTTACKKCNRSKRDKTVEQWRKK